MAGSLATAGETTRRFWKDEMQPADDGFTHFVMTDTPYYVGSPVQAYPPEGTLRAGTKVRLLEEAGSYTRVETEDGIQGYVASDALAGDATMTA